MTKAIFLDRDGTLNEEVDYLHEVEKLKLIPGVAKALVLLREAGFKLIVVSNQSGVGRGYFTVDDVEKVNSAMNEALGREGVAIDEFYYCPHIEADKCDCRKPSTALYERARVKYDIDMSESYFVGDKESDILAALKYKSGYALVLTGHDIDKEVLLKYDGHCYKDLLEFAKAITK